MGDSYMCAFHAQKTGGEQVERHQKQRFKKVNFNNSPYIARVVFAVTWVIPVYYMHSREPNAPVVLWQ